MSVVLGLAEVLECRDEYLVWQADGGGIRGRRSLIEGSVAVAPYLSCCSG